MSQIYATCAFSPADASIGFARMLACWQGFILNYILEQVYGAHPLGYSIEFIIYFLYDCCLWILINLYDAFHNLDHFIILYFES